nr:PREDICTED: striated muscle-specific serine/threonine-protein kinase-like [Bemisia tabaci]
MIKVDENDPIGELEPSFPYRDVQIKWNVDVKQFYELQSEIGRGKFGTVYKCKEKATGLALAAKFVAVGRRQDRKNVEREVEIMRELQHPRLIQIYDAFESSNVMCVVLELIEGGELFERVIDDDFILTEKACTVFVRQICEAVEFMHSKNILHLDMKPENILCLTKTGNRIKIIDFGLARKFDPGKKLQVLFGTPEFVAPEVVNFDQIGFGTDMWSVGVICYVLLSGLSPFMGENDVATMANVTIATYDFDDDAFSTISEDAKDFIRRLLLKDKDQRMTATQALQHAWLRRRPPTLTAPTPKRTVERLDSTKDNLRSCVDRWGDQTPTAFFIQPPAIKELETEEPKFPEAKPSVSIPNDFRPESLVSPTSPQSPLPKKIKLQGDEEKAKPKKTRTGSKKNKSPPTSLKLDVTKAQNAPPTSTNLKTSPVQSSAPSSTNMKPGEASPVQNSSPTSTSRKLSDVSPVHSSAPGSPNLKSGGVSPVQNSPPINTNRRISDASPAQSSPKPVVTNTAQVSEKPTSNTLNGLPKTQPQSPKSEKPESAVTPGSKVIPPAEAKSTSSNENSKEQQKITAQATDPKVNKVETVHDSAQPAISATQLLDTKPEPSVTQEPKTAPKPDPAKSPDINSNYIDVSRTSTPIPVQKPPPSSPSPVALPTTNNTVPKQGTPSPSVSTSEIKPSPSPPSPLNSKTTPPVFPRVNVIPITVEGKQETSSKTEEKPKPPKPLGNSNISGLKSIWGSKILANETKHHPIVKYNRTMSSPTPNTAKSRTVGPKPQKVPESEESQPKVILHRIEVEDATPSKKPQDRVGVTVSASEKPKDRVSVSVTDTSTNRKPINEWVNDRLLNDRFNIDRRASDISSLVNSDTFFDDRADCVGSRLAEEISRITDKFCRLNDDDKRSSDKAAIMAQERHDKITDLLNGKRRPKYRRITYLNRDVPVGSAPPPTNMTYYLTNCLTSNPVGPLWAGTDFLSAPGTPLGSPRSPSEGSLDADMIFQMLSEKLKADASIQNVAPPKKTGLINS